MKKDNDCLIGLHHLFSNETTVTMTGEPVYVCQECYAEVSMENAKRVYR